MQLVDRIGRRLKLRDLHILLAVVERGSMAKAAQDLAVSQPVVSKTIADLEATLGVRLLDRGRQGVDLGMRLAILLVPAFADNLAFAHQDGAHERVRLDIPAAALREL